MKKFIKFTFYTVLFIWATVVAVERLWFFNKPDSYPEFLIKSNIPTVDDEEFDKLYHQCGQTLDIVKLPPNQAYIRCGLFWPQATVWFTNNIAIYNGNSDE